MAIPWTDAELNRLGVMRTSGCGPQEIAETLGRTLKGVKAKINYLNLSPEMKQKRNEAERTRLRRGIRVRQPDGTLPRAPICAVVLADRDLRCNARPRDLTAALCGDPLPGYSALERRA